MKKTLIAGLVGVSVEHLKVHNRKMEPVIDTEISDLINARIAIALADDSELKFILLYEIYKYYKGEPFYESIFRPIFEGILFTRGLTAIFNDYVKHVDMSDYLRTLRDFWAVNPQKVKPAALLEAFKLHFLRSPADADQFNKTFTASDRKLLNLL